MKKQLAMLAPGPWPDYELLDCGGREKLERFGKQILIRPEPQAIWDKALDMKAWEKQAHAIFRTDAKDKERGEWAMSRGGADKWYMDYPLDKGKLTFKLSLTSFRHVGIFPEQASNWDFIYEACQTRPEARVMNLFAYTGGASLAAKAAGADVAHVDSIKQVVSWARENMEATGLENIRWVIEDAMLFAKREVKRERLYDGIILDPPSYGRGPQGEKWLLEEMIDELMQVCASLLKPNGFLVLNMYSMGFSPLIARNLVWRHFGKEAEAGELYLPSSTGFDLPLGTFARFR